ncbi:hypothetical protein HY358_00310 [Candidatus Roizmanbacteria bacterium]|nr:hypothetical protein [Candidatus Roizmanbacteria bacterium]
MGPGNMIRAVAATRGIPEVAAEQLLEDVNKYEVAGKAVTTIKELIRGKSNESMLDFTVLFDDPTVGRRLSNIKIRDPENKSEVKIISAWDDDTYFYVARVIGGKVLLDEYNQKPKMAA